MVQWSTVRETARLSLWILSRQSEREWWNGRHRSRFRIQERHFADTAAAAAAALSLRLLLLFIGVCSVCTGTLNSLVLRSAGSGLIRLTSDTWGRVPCAPLSPSLSPLSATVPSLSLSHRPGPLSLFVCCYLLRWSTEKEYHRWANHYDAFPLPGSTKMPSRVPNDPNSCVALRR